MPGLLRRGALMPTLGHVNDTGHACIQGGCRQDAPPLLLHSQLRPGLIGMIRKINTPGESKVAQLQLPGVAVQQV